MALVLVDTLKGAYTMLDNLSTDLTNTCECGNDKRQDAVYCAECFRKLADRKRLRMYGGSNT